MGVIGTRTFKSGNSVAVRLPKELGYEVGMAVHLEQDGSVVTIRPAIDPVAEKRKLTDLIARLRDIGPILPVSPREPIEFPDRPNLY